MSLLPGHILPQTEPIGTVNEDKSVTIDKNWWLYLYNVGLQTLGTGAAAALPSSGATLLASADSDAIDADAIALRQPIQNLAAQPGDLAPTAADFPDIARALLLAQDGLLGDPPAQAQPVAAITVTGSPFTYTAGFDGEVVITGTVTSVAIVRQGVSVATGLLVGIFPIRRKDQLVVTYPAAAPTMTFLPN
jgi:hypothetical protein